MLQQIEFSLTSEFQIFMAGLPTLEKAASIIHGVFIDLHPVWKGIVDFQRATGFYDDYGDWPLYGDWLLRGEMGAVGPYDPDKTRLPKHWEYICSRHNKMPEPFVVKIWVIPTTALTLALRRQVEDYARAQPFFVVVEDREPAQLAVNVEGATGITAVRSGTLGGLLMDQHQQLWGVTCGHVAQMVGGSVTLDDIHGVQFVGAGTVRYSNFASLVPTPPSGLCNQYVDNAQPEVDAALIELSSNFTGLNSVRGLGTIDEIYDRTRLQSGTTVWMTGTASRSIPRPYVIGGYGVTLKAKLQNPGGSSDYCFSHVFEFHDPGRATSGVPGRIAQAMTHRPLQGDSGSWICYKKQQNCAYFGNLFAVQGANGIATFADALVSWARLNSLTLRVF
jgi:hypothetical protein